MPRKGQRRRIATRCYEDGSGRSITYTDPSTGRQAELRFPRNTPIGDMREARASAVAASSGSGRANSHPGTLDAAVDEWEPLEKTLSSWQERRAELRAWCRAAVSGARVGGMRLAAIDDKIARAVLSQWTQAGVAPKTIRNRRWSLQHLYRVLNGPKADTPVDDIPPPPKTKTIPQIVDPALVLRVYARLLEAERRGLLRDAKTRARFMVRASTGRRPVEIMRAEPEDVNLERREWRVRDAKGGWSEGQYLNDDMIAAWRVFVEAKAWGPFNTGSMAKALRSAGWKPGVRPYELRHSVGIALSDAGVDLADISGVLGHSDLRTTRQTYVPIRQARMQRASEALEGRFNSWSVPSNVPYPEVDRSGFLSISKDSTHGAAGGRKRRKSLGK
jgi:integrase